MDPQPQLISYSQIYAWNRCRYLWDLRYRRHIGRRITERPLSVGGAVHRGVDAGVRTRGDLDEVTAAVESYGDDWLQEIGRELEDDEREHIENVLSDSSLIARNSVRDIDFERWETIELGGVPLIESRLVVPISRSRNWDGFIFVCDWVARDHTNGLVWVIDHKVRKAFLPADAEEVNQQAAVYQYGLRSVGVGTAGSICHQIRSSPPKAPKLNKNGTMSRARISTTWERYVEELVACGLSPEDYREEMWPKLDAEFQRWDQAYRSEAELDAVWDDVVVPAAQTISRKDKKIWRALNYMDCNGCSMREFCLAELRGHDAGFLLGTDFIDHDNPSERRWRAEDIEFLETETTTEE
jgi:hypothetical protein